MSVVDAEVSRMTERVAEFRSQKLDRLKNLDLFCLDNSIRESTVGQLRSHTLENKIAIFEEVKKCGIKDMIVASFAHMTRVDDDFVQHLIDTGEDFSNFYSFSEVSEVLKDGVYDTEKIPIGLLKNKKYGLRHTFFEMDLANKDCDWGGKWTVEAHCQMLLRLFRWVRREIYQDARILVNVRDFGLCMASTPKRLLEFVRFLASLPPEERIFAFVFEDVLGDSLPEELEMWTASVRNVMDSCGWKSGKLLLHIHQQWDLQTAAVLSCLSAGADGVWASLCEEGASVGHACSTVTIMNLVRLGNTKVLEKYDCHHLRSAARKVTKITTGKDPPPKQVLYGERAVDMVFGIPLGVARTFDVAKFFGVKPIIRMSTMASAEMIRDRLITVFGEHPQFTIEIAEIMKEKMLEDLREGRKEEYMSKVGLGILFERAGGKLANDMVDGIESTQVENPFHQQLIDEVRQLWDEWNHREKEQDENRMQFDSFYHGFMSPYFGCYRCHITKHALQALDLDSDGYVEWKEFLVYIRWALREYPSIRSADEVLDIAFQKGLLPIMRDEQIKKGSTIKQYASSEYSANYHHVH